jgi:hypothetical protein
MVVKKKKKKKEEFDASLMGGYLPGARPPVSSIPPISHKVRQNISDIPMPYSTFELTNAEWLNYEITDLANAWTYYAFGGGPFQLATQTPQAYGAYKFGVYPSFKMALIYELGWGTVILATLHTILDPHRVWRDPFTEKMDPQFTDPQFIPEGMTHGGYL